MSARLLALLLCCCGAAVADAGGGGPLAGSRQLVLVVADDWDTDRATLSLWRRDRTMAWTRSHAPVAVTLGRSGSAWGDGLHPQQHDGPRKREGDGRSPAGVFAIGPAFGAAPEFDTRLAYHAMDAADWCIDVPESPLYNRIVDSSEVGEAAVAGSTEPMRRDLHANGDQRYSRGLVVQHNQAAAPGAGSCIFVHVWGGPGQPTAGCTAMDQDQLDRLLAALDPARSPRFVLLPLSEYRRLAAEWQLPPPPQD